MEKRASPVGKKVSLFVTCMIDMIYPQTGMAVVEILEHLGISVDFPMAQTCCGQPAYNGGYRHDAKQVALQFLKAFRDAEAIVTPSGSCAAMVRHEYPVLFADDRELLPLVKRLASVTWEFTEFLVDGLGVDDLKLALPHPQKFAIHDSCHGLRMLGLGKAVRDLLSYVENAEMVELVDSNICCGFGGLFSIKMADISNAMLQKKIANINTCPADTIITTDVSCLTQMNGGLLRQKSLKRVRHIAEVLGEALHYAS